jgi:hypothetical protein
MNLPVIILLSLGGLFVLVFLLFFFSTRQQEKKEKQLELESYKALKVEMSDAAEQPKPDPAEVQTPTVPEESPSGYIEFQAEPDHDEQKSDDIEPGVHTEVKKSDGESAGEPDFGGMADYSEMLEGEGMEIDLEDREEQPSSDEEPTIILQDEMSGESKTVSDIESKTVFSEDDSSEEQVDVITPGLGGTASMDTDTPAEDTISPEDIFGKDEPEPADVTLAETPVTASAAKPPEALSEKAIDSLFESMAKGTMEKTVKPSAPKPEVVMDPEEAKRHEKAQRIARVIINDIRNYNPEHLAEGIRVGNIMKTLGVEIERGRQLYIKRVPPDIAKTTNYYRESLIKILSDGQPKLFGWD